MVDRLDVSEGPVTGVIARCRGCGWTAGAFDGTSMGDALAEHLDSVPDGWHRGKVQHAQVLVALEETEPRFEGTTAMLRMLADCYAFASAPVPVPLVAR